MSLCRRGDGVMSNGLSMGKTQKLRKVLKRKRLNLLLKETIRVPLTVVTAPAGYGKTTAVRNFLAGRKEDITWVHFTHINNDTDYFWNKFSNIFAKTNKTAADKLYNCGFPSDISRIDDVFKTVKSCSDATIKHIVVLDDYHLISQQKINAFIETLAREKINNLHIVIITRHDPGFNLIDLNMKQLVNIISQNELEFSTEEIQEYAKLCDCKISLKDAQRIHRITEGWISAIYLFMLEYRQSGKIGDTININNLMAKTVYQQFDEETQHLLALLSIPDSFTKTQIEYATENPTVLNKIDLFYETNAFIKYDIDNNVFRMHSLFRQFLNQKLKELNEIDKKRFYVRIGQWYTENNDFMTGIRYFFEAGEYERLLRAVETDGTHGIIQIYKSFLISCFDNIPKDILYKFPIAIFVYIIRLITFNEEKKAIHLLGEYQQYIENTDEIGNERKRKILGEIAFIISIASFNDLHKMVEYHKKAHDLLDHGTSIGNEQNPFTFGSPSLLYLYYNKKGNLENIVGFFEQSIKYYRYVTRGCGTGSEYTLIAEHCFETGKFTEAELIAKKAIYSANTKNQIGIIIAVKFVIIRIAIHNGDVYKALKVFNEIEEMVINSSQQIYFTTLDICKGYLYYLIRDYDKIPQWIREGDMSNSNIYSQSEGISYIVFGQSLLLIENYIRLDALCSTMRNLFDKYTYQIGYIYTGIFSAVCKYRLYGIEQAKPLLIQALETGKSDDIIMLFVENYEHISDILLAVKQDNCFDINYLDRINEHYAVYEKSINKIRREYRTRIKNPALTKREKEILELICQKKTNKQIAQELFITEATVKKTTSNIYKKLNVKGRKEVANFYSFTPKKLS